LTKNSEPVGKNVKIPQGDFFDSEISSDMTVNDLGNISRSLDCFTSNFS